MRDIFIPDIHGYPLWRKIVEDNEGSRFIFVGDYLDSHLIGWEEQLNNFRDILEFKRNNPATILLTGNHEQHYTYWCHQRYAGFQKARYYTFNQELERAYNDGLIRMAFQINDIVITHAGVSNTWYDEVPKIGTVAEDINEYWRVKPVAFNLRGSDEFQNSGNSVTQSPTWIRPESLLEDKLKGYRQIVGHTAHDNLIVQDGIYFIDGIGTHKSYLILEDGRFSLGKI